MTLNQEQAAIVLQAALHQEETQDLIKLITNEPNLGFIKHLMIAKHFMGTILLGVPPQSLINQLITEYSKNQWNILGRLMMQARMGKTLNLSVIRDPYVETICLQIMRELKKHKVSTNTGQFLRKNKNLRVDIMVTHEDLQNVNNFVLQYKDLGILPHWMFIANFMGIKPEGWHKDQKDLLSQLQSLLYSFKTGHCKFLQQLTSMVQSGKTISLKEVSPEQEERLASMMKILNGLFMFPTLR